MTISPRSRFAILARDSFTCLYCGRKPPEVALHVDHRTPVAEGGTDADTNLVTACQDCNLGKSSGTLQDGIRHTSQPSAPYARGQKRIFSLNEEDYAAIAAVIFSRETFSKFMRRAAFHEIQFRKREKLRGYNLYDDGSGGTIGIEIRT